MIVGCSSCGKSNTIPDQPRRDGYYVCSVCKTVLDIETDGGKAGANYGNSPRCKRCDAFQEPGSRFCYRCGLPIESDEAASTFVKDEGSFRSLGTRANWTTVFLVIFALITLGAILITSSEIDILQRVNEGQTVSEAEILSIREGLSGMSFIYWASLLISSIAFLFWIYTASKNLASLNMLNQRFSPRWAIIWWFVPIMWFFRPYQVMKEIWNGSDPAHVSSSEPTSRSTSYSLLKWWWTTWIVSIFLVDFNYGFEPIGQGARNQIWGSTFSIAGLFSVLVCTVLLIVIVRKTTSRQEVHNKMLQAQAKSD